MVASLPRWLLLAAVGLGLAVVVVKPAPACPFCSGQSGLTLAKEVDQASMVLYGSLKNAKQGEDFSSGTTEMLVETAIKDHKIRDNQKTVVIDRFVPPDDRYKHLVFFDVFKGKANPYQGRPFKADSDIVKYLDGAIKVKDKDQPTRLRFYFDFLDNADSEITGDAFKEFAYADYKDYQGMAKDLPADKLTGWLQDPKTPPFRFGLYGSLLGHCGKDKHAEVIRQMLEATDGPPLSGVDGLFAGYILLKPKEGYELLCKFLKDAERDWPTRYAALRAARFFWDTRSDVLNKDKLAEAVALMLPQGDIADLAIEDLRKWERWETAEKVLGLQAKESHKAPIVQRAIIRYALSCPKSDRAETLLAELRTKQPKLVQETAELLKLENIK